MTSCMFSYKNCICILVVIYGHKNVLITSFLLFFNVITRIYWSFGLPLFRYFTIPPSKLVPTLTLFLSHKFTTHKRVSDKKSLLLYIGMNEFSAKTFLNYSLFVCCIDSDLDFY